MSEITDTINLITHKKLHEQIEEAATIESQKEFYKSQDQDEVKIGVKNSILRLHELSLHKDEPIAKISLSKVRESYILDGLGVVAVLALKAPDMYSPRIVTKIGVQHPLPLPERINIDEADNHTPLCDLYLPLYEINTVYATPEDLLTAQEKNPYALFSAIIIGKAVMREYTSLIENQTT
ncbi:MAG: hypothetical protein NVSMB46_00190 [Candidatus Saccharimonadales bacterium]